MLGRGGSRIYGKGGSHLQNGVHLSLFETMKKKNKRGGGGELLSSISS